MKWLWGVCSLLIVVGASSTSWAECRILSAAPTYTAGQLKDLTCATNGALMMGGAPGSATAAAPTFTEGSSGYFSFDLAGNARVTLGTQIFGEDSDNDLLMTSGGATRTTQILGTGGIPSTATDATSSVSILPTGVKTFQGVVTCTGTCVQTQKIYGTYANSATVAQSSLVCTLTISGTTTASDWCATDRAFNYWFVVTTLTSGTTPLSGIFVQY